MSTRGGFMHGSAVVRFAAPRRGPAIAATGHSSQPARARRPIPSNDQNKPEREAHAARQASPREPAPRRRLRPATISRRPRRAGGARARSRRRVLRLARVLANASRWKRCRPPRRPARRRRRGAECVGLRGRAAARDRRSKVTGQHHRSRVRGGRRRSRPGRCWRARCRDGTRRVRTVAASSLEAARPATCARSRCGSPMRAGRSPESQPRRAQARRAERARRVRGRGERTEARLDGRTGAEVGVAQSAVALSRQDLDDLVIARRSPAS
jgi:hypothetical protein